MKSKNMKKIILLIIVISVSCKLIAQDSFSEFIASFPKYSSWDALPEDIRDIKISDGLSKQCHSFYTD
jgi:hypothetical protein